MSTTNFNSTTRMYYLMTCFCLIVVGLKGCTEKQEKHPNVILIMTDDQGYGDVRAHGNPYIHTPNLDKLHGESVRFVDFHVNPFCSPTRAALMTGRLSDRSQVRSTIYLRNHLSREETTMAEFFKATGYQTGQFGKWHLGRNYPYRPIDRGFDQWVGLGDGGLGTASDYWGNDRMNDHYYRNGVWEFFEGFGTDVFFDEAMKFIEGAGGDPFFVYLATNIPHGPMNVMPEWREPWEGQDIPGTSPWGDVVDLYATLARFDQNVGRLRTFLEEKGLDENTILIFLTDNGTANGAQAYNAGMRGRKGSLYEGGHRVPCFIHWPKGGMDQGVDVDRFTAHIDLLPTLIEVCGLQTPERGHLDFDGRSLVPLLRDPGAAWADRTLIMHVQNTMEYPEKGRSTLVATERWRLVNGRELYDIVADFSQENDVADQHPEVVADLSDRYEAYWEASGLGYHPYPRPVIGSGYDKETWLTSDGWVIDRREPHTWNQVHVLAGVKNSGYWLVEIARKGTYCFDVRRWPKELDHPIAAALPADTNSDITCLGEPVIVEHGEAIPAAKVRLRVGDRQMEKEVGPADVRAVFEMPLPPGPTVVRAWLLDGDNNEWGAYYVYASLREQSVAP
jgi:arylsulfatase A-like enzyme